MYVFKDKLACIISLIGHLGVRQTPRGAEPNVGGDDDRFLRDNARVYQGYKMMMMMMMIVK